MDTIKVEVKGERPLKEQDCLSFYISCFICLQPASKNNEQFNPLNLFLEYLKISGGADNAILCDKCEEKLIRFGKLSNYLEKVKLEIDYLLGFIQDKILKSNKDLAKADANNFVRESVVKKCKGKISNPMAEIVLEKADLSKSIKKERQAQPAPDYSEDWTPNLRNDYNSSHSEHILGTPATPVISQVNFKMEEDWEEEQDKGPKYSTISSKKTSLKRPTNTFRRHLKPFKCPTCLKEFGDLSSLRVHINVVHLHPKPYKCDKCPQSFARANKLSQHKAREHDQAKANSQIFCEMCNRGFGNFNLLKAHVQRVHNKKRFKCDICNKTFQWKDGLQRHFVSKHDKERYCCQVPGCHKIYTFKSQLEEHYQLKHHQLTYLNFKGNYKNRKGEGYSG